MRRLLPLALGAYFVGAISLAGCAGDDATAVAQCRPPQCVAADQLYAAEVAAQEGSGIPLVEFGHVDLDPASGSFAMNVSAPVLLRGVVLSGGSPVPATVVASRPSRISGRPDVYYQATVSPSDGTYFMLVPPSIEGESYSIRVSPSDPARYPPSVSTASLEEDRALDFDLPSGDDLLTVEGKLTDALQGAIADARVSLRDALALADLSTIGRTDERGRFTISIPVDAQTYGGSSIALAVTSGDVHDPEKGLTSATLTLDPTTLKDTLAQSALSMQFPAVPSKTRLTIRVVGMGANGIDKDVAGANVRLRTNLIDPTRLGTFTARHEIQTTTNTEGKIEVDLYSDQDGARTYELAISPTADSEFQTTVTTLIVGTASGVGAPIRLAARRLVSGRVIDASGLPLKGAVIQPALAQTTGIAASVTSLATTASLGSGISDEDGRFALRLDEGNYEFGVIPPVSAHLPRRWLPGVAVSGDVDLGDVVTPTPVTFDAIVVHGDASQLMSTVRLYSIPAGNSACENGNAGCLLPPRLLAEGITKMDGHASLILAAE